MFGTLFNCIIILGKELNLSSMTTTRLEAFSDGVLAIIITIMVLEIKVPHDTSWKALTALAPVFNSLCAELYLHRHLLG
jgi:uncharacterized membrane protein